MGKIRTSLEQKDILLNKISYGRVPQSKDLCRLKFMAGPRYDGSISFYA